jgi:hypothetical protein
MTTAGSFQLLAGKTYQLSAQISGNQRTSNSDQVEFGFLRGSNLTGAFATGTRSVTIPGSAGYNLYSVYFTPTANTNARVFFYDVGGTSNSGPILDNVILRAVPLPAAAWLMLSGVAALFAVARRRRGGNELHTAGGAVA